MGGILRARSYKKAVVAATIMLIFARMAAAGVTRIGISAEDLQPPWNVFWQTTVDYLGQVLPEEQFVLESMSPDELRAALKKQTVDAAVVDPAVPVTTGSRADPLATPRYRFKGREFTGSAGALVVRMARADLRTWADLRSAEIATADAGSLRDWLAVSRELQYVRWTGRVRIVASRQAALADVLSGRVEAAAVPAEFLLTTQNSGSETSGAFHVIRPGDRNRSQLTVWPIAVSTPVYPGLAFVAMESLSPDLRRRVAAALLAMPPPSPEAADGIAIVGWEPFGCGAEVHAVLRDLGMSPYSRVREISLADAARRFTYVFVYAGALVVVGLAVIFTLTATNRALRAEVARRCEAEKALLRSIERFEHITSCSSDWIWECDERGVFTYTNSNVRPMLGFDPQEIFGRHHLEFLAELERQRLAAEGRGLFDGGRRVFREVFRMRTKDGRLVVHEITAEPVRDADGKVVGYRGVNRDISDRARAIRLTT